MFDWVIEWLIKLMSGYQSSTNHSVTKYLLLFYQPGQSMIVPLSGKGNYVFGVGGKLDWQSARERCCEIGMDLAIVESEEANLLVGSMCIRLLQSIHHLHLFKTQPKPIAKSP